ncbi:hypothetical protein KWD47_04420 [Acinetobacter baumannii]
MKPGQFIREFGVEKARWVVEYKGSKCGIAQSYSPLTGKYYSLLEGVFYFFSESTNQFLKYADEVSSTLDLIDLSDLKRLVESINMIESFGGINEAKEYDRLVDGGFFAKAIRDHESIYGGGDE